MTELSKLHAVNLQLVGALEAVSRWWKTGDDFDSVPMEQIDNALSGDGIEKYRELFPAFQKLLEWCFNSHDWNSLTTPDVVVAACKVSDALQSGEPPTGEKA